MGPDTNVRFIIHYVIYRLLLGVRGTRDSAANTRESPAQPLPLRGRPGIAGTCG